MFHLSSLVSFLLSHKMDREINWDLVENEILVVNIEIFQEFIRALIHRTHPEFNLILLFSLRSLKLNLQDNLLFWVLFKVFSHDICIKFINENCRNHKSLATVITLIHENNVINTTFLIVVDNHNLAISFFCVSTFRYK